MIKTDERSDIIILLAATLLATILVTATIGFNKLFSGSIDIPLYDTFFNVPKFKVFVLAISMLVYVVFLVRQLLSGFRTNFGNYVLIASGLILLLSTAFIEKLTWIFRLLMNVGWHTELSEDGSLLSEDLAVEIVFIIIKVTIVGTLLLTGFKIGLNKKRDSD